MVTLFYRGYGQIANNLNPVKIIVHLGIFGYNIPVYRYIKALKDIFFPDLCLACRAKSATAVLCPSCREKIELVAEPANGAGGRHYDRLLSAAYYQGPLEKVVHAFKYRHADYLAPFLSDLMLKQLYRLDLRQYDLITAVPAHPLKVKDRGYNPARLLACRLSRRSGLPFASEVLRARHYRPSQTRLSKAARAKNVREGFYAPQDLTGKKIVLVDDVATTGATLDECARALKTRGAREVTALTAAKRAL